MLTVSTITVILATLFPIVIAHFRSCVRDKSCEQKVHGQRTGSSQRENWNLKSLTVANLLSGDCTTAMPKLAKDRSELFSFSNAYTTEWPRMGKSMLASQIQPLPQITSVR
jgi:hypothetical protein